MNIIKPQAINLYWYSEAVREAVSIAVNQQTTVSS